LFAARAQPAHPSRAHGDRSSPEVAFKRLHAPSLTPFQETTRSHPHPLCKAEYVPLFLVVLIPPPSAAPLVMRRAAAPTASLSPCDVCVCE